MYISESDANVNNSIFYVQSSKNGLASERVRDRSRQIFVPHSKFVKCAIQGLAPFFLLLVVVSRENVSDELVGIVR